MKLIINNKEAIIGNEYPTGNFGKVLLIGTQEPTTKESQGLVFTAKDTTLYVWYPSVINGEWKNV